MSKIKKIFCNICHRQTNHELDNTHYRFCYKSSELKHLTFIELVDLKEPIDFRDSEVVFRYEIWICRGCDTPTLRESCTAKQLVGSEKVAWSYDLHPQRITEKLSQGDIGNAPAKLSFFYYEVIESFNNSLPVLCSIGLRALLEGICKDKGISDKEAWSLTKKIEELARRQHLPTKIAENLKSYKFIGDSAAHELESPDMEILKSGIEVMEDLLTYLYRLEFKSSWLYERVLDNKKV